MREATGKLGDEIAGGSGGHETIGPRLNGRDVDHRNQRRFRNRMAGDAPKPASPELDGPIAQEASGKTIETARRFSRRMWVPTDER
ncbi:MULTISPECIES: hypothetical protein [Paraburkholderia]|uniref:hypothetical protein n=1 Tax=Paraburkholderia TaxID=1822464 RepID=UPI0016564505|nr:hypothetical protein [Paraburkholderia podalyriae]